MPSRFDKFDSFNKTSLGVFGSAPLANIIYNMDAFNVTDTNTRTVDNVGSLKSTADGDMYGSNFIELGAGQSVPLSIPYTLGSEDYTGICLTSTNITETSLGGGDYNFVATASTDLGDWIKFTNTTNTTEQVNEFVFNVAINSGTVTFIQYYIGGVKTVLTNPIVITNGGNRIVIENDTVFDAIVFVPEELTAWDADFTGISIKQITNHNSFLTTFDYTNKQHQTVDNSLNTPSTTYSQTNDFNIGFGHTSNLEQEDYDALRANPNLIYNVWFDNYVLPSGFAKANMVNFYPANEGVVAGEKIYDISDVSFLTFVSIINYTASCRTALANQNYGATNHLVKQDATGRAIDLADAGTIEHNGDGRTLVVKTRTSTRTVTIELTPDAVELKTLVSTTTAGTITMIADGSVTASSGIVTIDTTTLQIGVKSLITVTGLAIDGVSTLFDGLDGRVHTYTEDIE